MTPARVAYVINVFPKLSETFIAGELAELRQQGVDVRILSLRRPTDTLRHDIVARAGLDALTCYAPEKFRDVLRDFKPEILHAHFATEPTAAARELAAEMSLPFTFTAHGYDIRRKPPADFAARAAAAHGLVTVSHANAQHITERFGVGADRIRIIPCGVDLDRFRPPAARSSEVPIILCVARHVKVKNLDLLLHGCALLRDRHTSFQCVLVGDGPLRAELEESCRNLNLENFITFTGALEQSDVVQWWQRAFIAVLTSDNEGMPVCLMEAAACGVPAVATAVGGVPELVGEGVTGLLVPGGDANALADSLQRLLEDNELARRMGAAARRRAEECFSVTRQVNCLRAFWAEVLQSNIVS